MYVCIHISLSKIVNIMLGIADGVTKIMRATVSFVLNINTRFEYELLDYFS